MQNHHLQGDSSSSDEDLHPRSHPDRPRHIRSVSHPFPSLFSSKKKRVSPTVADDDSDSESGVDGPVLKGKPPLMRNHRSGSSAGSKDFATGRCMTCGSLVRWPRELQTFRCTICMTINDLKPLSQDARHEDATQEEDVVCEEQPRKGMSVFVLPETLLFMHG
jgi:E3 ubiquitin-protein ligase HECTD2